jgi:rhodanese-related sulfurtransferase
MAETSLDAGTLADWLNTGKPVTVVDVRPQDQRAEWFITGSIHVDAYDQAEGG